MEASRKTISDFGRFDTRDGCFVLKAKPPRKWVNIHYNQPGEHEVYAEVTNIGDGPVTIRDNEGCTCKLVGYDSKYVYIRDDETNTVFNPGGEPVATPVTGVETRYYAAKTETRGTCRGLRATHRTFVPADHALEAHTVWVENRTKRERTVSVFGYAMFDLTGKNATGGGVWKDNDSRIHPELHGVYVHNRDRSVPTNRFNGYLVALPHEGYVASTGYRDFFTGQAFSLAAPNILQGGDLNNRPFRGPDCAGAVQVRLRLAPGETGRVDYLLGQATSPEDVGRIRASLSPEKLDEACAGQMRREEKRAAAFTVDTGDKNRDALINIFVKKQMTSYLINKSGFRDNLQNDMGVSLFEPAMARDNLLRALASQYVNGSVPHSFRPFNFHQYSDKPAWMLHCVPWYIKESGDFAILDEEVPFYDNPEPKSVWEHMLRAMRFLANDTGANGLCDQHFADWNDGLEPSEKTGPRESVMVTQQLCLGLLEVRELARRRGDAEVLEEAKQLHADFTDRLNSVAWDGEWYTRTLTASGYTLGSNKNPEGKIFVNPQSWAVLSGTASPERARQCMEAVDTLIETDYGFPICAPAFTEFDERIGKFSASRPYHVENGGCYNHAAGFKTVADCMLGRTEQAWRTLIKLMPDSPWNPVGNSVMEPFSFTNCFSLTEEWPGLSVYGWRTGTASWFTMALVEWILGARRHYDGLLIDPCLSKEVPKARLTRTFRGATYRIEIDNRSGRGRGIQKLTINGKKVSDPILKGEPGQTYKVKVVL